MSSPLGIRRHTTRFVLSKTLPITLAAMLPLLIVLVVAAVRLSHHKDTPNANASTAENSAFYRYNVGERLVYAINYANRSTSDFQKVFARKESSGKMQKSAASTLAQSFSTRVQGNLTATVFDRKDDTILIAFSLRNAAVSIATNGQAAMAEAEMVKTDLSRAIFVQSDIQGRVISVRFDPSANSLSQGFARAVLAITQFVFPDDGKSSGLSRWEVQEDDTGGRCIASYEVQAAHGNCDAKDTPSVKMFRKTKVRYVEHPAKTVTDNFDIASRINPGGKLIAGFDFDQGRVVCLSGKESQAVLMAGKTVAQGETTISLNYAATEKLSAVELRAMRSANIEREKVAVSASLSAKVSEEESEASIQRTELEDATLESLLSDLASLEASTDEKKNETALYLKFKALVYLHPDASAPLGRILAASPAGSASSRILTGALGAVGHAEAQLALVTVIQAHTEDWVALSMLIPALASARSPTQAAENALRQLAANSADWNIASTSQLALGLMARSLADKSPERAAKIVDWSLSNLESSSSAETARQWLLVLGNTGAAEALPVIARYTSDRSTRLCAAAVSALRFIKSRQAEQLLIEALASDADDVRLAAAVALGFREMSLVGFKAQKNALMNDKAVRVRLEALKNLWQAREEFPQIRRLVRHSAAKDASSEVRKAAAGFMSN